MGVPPQAWAGEEGDRRLTAWTLDPEKAAKEGEPFWLRVVG